MKKFDTIYLKNILQKPEVKKTIKAGSVGILVIIIFFGTIFSLFTPKPKSAAAATTSVTYAFATTNDGWAGNGGTSTVDSYQSGLGNPAGAVQSRITGRGQSNTTAGWVKTGVTWESLGIPAGSTIDSVDGRYDWRCSEYTTGASSNSGALTITDAANGNVTTLESGLNYTATSAWATRNATTTVAIPAALQSSAASIKLRVLGNLATGNSSSAANTRQIDNVILTINYTPPVARIRQMGYHWRNNDGGEADATSRTEGVENTEINPNKNTVLRLRLSVANKGTANHTGAAFRLEYAQAATCSAGTYYSVPTTATTEPFNMADASAITDGTSTTNIDNAIGGVTDSNTNFVTGQFKENSNITSSIALNTTQFTEVEYSITPNNNAVWGGHYCFRLTDNGTSFDQIVNYAELTMATEPPSLEQVHYRWRNDDGPEIGVPIDVSEGATGSEVVTTGWTNVLNAYDLTNNNIYATAAPGKNAYISNNFTNFGFDTSLPTDASINSVNITAQYKVSTTSSVADLTVIPVVSGVNCGTGENHAAEPLSDFDFSLSATSCRNWVRDDLLNSNFKVEISAHRGNSNTAVTFSLDFVMVTVNYSTPGATFAENEDTVHGGQVANNNIRLRFLLANTGGTISQTYKPQFVSKTSSCELISSGWTNIPTTTSTEPFEFTPSVNFTDQTETQNISGGLTDPAGTFIAGYLTEDPSSASNAVSLANGEFTELEYNFTGTTNAFGSYCFRLVRGATNTPLDTYSVYPEISFGSSNNNPNLPASLTQKDSLSAAISESAWTNDNTPELGFTITDTDTGNTVKYQIQIADNALFASPVIDYTHGSLSPSGTTFTFTIGNYADGTCNGSCPSVLFDEPGYWWRVKAMDNVGAVSGWSEFGNAGTTDFKSDATAPIGGTVADGTGSDQDWNNGVLNSLSANWTGVIDVSSGIQKYEYQVQRLSDSYYWNNGWQSGTNWVNNNNSTSFTVNPIYLETGVNYVVWVRATDNAGNVMSTPILSNGQQVLPTLSFSLSTNSITFANLNSINSWTDSEPVNITTSTNAKNGYVVQAYLTQLVYAIINPSITIPNYSGTWASPTDWSAGQYGFGYTSSDTSVQGSNRFNNGNNYCAYSLTAPGNIVADNPGPISGQSGAITNETFTITNRISTSSNQVASDYKGNIIFVVTANY